MGYTGTAQQQPTEVQIKQMGMLNEALLMLQLLNTLLLSLKIRFS
jgi:hypothetical protein